MVVSVVYGGSKEERGASEKNAKDIAQALKNRGYTAILIPYGEDILQTLRECETDVVYVCVQGKGYGDGSLQAILEQAKIPFTGSDMRAACLINDKILCKMVFEHYGISTAKWDILTRHRYEAGDYNYEAFGFPFVAKAPTQGGSFGIELIHNKEELERIRKVFDFDDPIFLERFVSGGFYTVGLYESHGKLVVLPVVEGLDLRNFNDDKNEMIKFTGEYGIGECKLPPALTDEMSDLAKKVFQVTGAKGVARVDFMVEESTMRPYVLEINAVPGLKRASLMPREAAMAGIDYEDMIEDILKAAL